MTDDLTALLRACHAEPDCDLPRLVLADWLTETGQPERGELIRVQCELARVAGQQDPDCEKAARSREAHAYVDVQTMKPTPCTYCWSALRRREAELIEVVEEQIGKAFLAGFGEVPANDCEWRWVRGLLHVAAPLADLEAGLRRMGQDAWWVGSVRATDKNPRRWRDEKGRVGWWRVYDLREMSYDDLEPELWDWLDGQHKPQSNYYNDCLKLYDTPDAAHADLSRALLASVREPARVAATKGG